MIEGHDHPIAIELPDGGPKKDLHNMVVHATSLLNSKLYSHTVLHRRKIKKKDDDIGCDESQYDC